MYIETIITQKKPDTPDIQPTNNTIAYVQALKSANGFISTNTNTINSTTFEIKNIWNTFEDYQNFTSNTINQNLFFMSSFDRIPQYLQSGATVTLSYTTD